MPFAQSILDAHTFAETHAHGFDSLTEQMPREWVDSAAQLSSHATIRRRRLPGDMVLWLVVGMAMFRSESIAEVARRLNICASGLANDALLARSALSQARQRLGAEPMKWLFQRSARVWGAERYRGDDWNGLQLFALDGALFRTPDTVELREHFGSGNTSTTRQTPFPILRLVALMNVRSHVVLDAAISPYRRGEVPLANSLLQHLPERSITLLDKGFFSADLLLSIAKGKQRHWVIPERKRLVYQVVHEYGPGDRLVEMTVSPQARKANPELPASWQARAVTYEVGAGTKTIFTSLPAEQYSAEQVAQLYHQRWEIELGFRDIKSSMQHNAITLRSKKVELIYQELWGLLLAYNVVRREASKAAVEHGREPQDVSFKFAFEYIAAQLIVMAGALSPAHTPRRLAELRGCIANMFIEKRPRPSRPRAVKISKTRYPINRHAAPLK